MSTKLNEFYENKKIKLIGGILGGIILAGLTFATAYFLFKLLAIPTTGEYFKPVVSFGWKFLACGAIDFIMFLLIKPFYGYQTIPDHIDNYKSRQRRLAIEKAERKADEEEFKLKQAEIRAEYKALAAQKKAERKAAKLEKKAAKSK